MPTFRDIRVVVWPGVGWRLQWWIEDLEPKHDIVIERSQGEEGPWSEVDTVSHTEAGYEDTEVPYRSYWTLFFYRLRVEDSGTTVATSKPAGTTRKADRVTRKIIHEYERHLEAANVQNAPYALQLACFKRAISGTKCPNCIDPNTGKRLIDRCATCDGTGYVEGWSNPIKFNARSVDGATKRTQMTQQNESEDDKRTFFTAAYPTLEPHDILAEKESGRRWRVLSVDTSEPNGVLVSQRFRVERVDREHIEAELMYPGES